MHGWQNMKESCLILPFMLMELQPSQTVFLQRLDHRTEAVLEPETGDGSGCPKVTY